MYPAAAATTATTIRHNDRQFACTQQSCGNDRSSNDQSILNNFRDNDDDNASLFIDGKIPAYQ